MNRELIVSRAFEAYLIGKGQAVITARRYMSFVDDFLRWSAVAYPGVAIAALGYADLIPYLSYCQQAGLSRASVQKKVIGVRHYFDYLMSMEAIDHNPARYLKVQTSQHRRLFPVLSPDQLEGLYHAYDTSPAIRQHVTTPWMYKQRKLTVGLMVWQGLESATLSRLTVDDVNLGKGTIYIRGGRRYLSRELKLEAVQIMELYHYVNEIHPKLVAVVGPADPSLLLVNGFSTYSDAHKVIIGHLKAQHAFLTPEKGGIPVQVRSSVIIGWLKKGHNLRQVQYMAGYRKVCSVEALLRSDIESLQEDVDRFFPL